MHLNGREAITAGIGHVFATVYRGSSIEIEVVAARSVSPSVIVTQLRHVVDAPALPDPDPMMTLATAVVVDTVEGRRVAAFHNTAVADH